MIGALFTLFGALNQALIKCTTLGQTQNYSSVPTAAEFHNHCHRELSLAETQESMQSQTAISELIGTTHQIIGGLPEAHLSRLSLAESPTNLRWPQTKLRWTRIFKVLKQLDNSAAQGRVCITKKEGHKLPQDDRAFRLSTITTKTEYNIPNTLKITEIVVTFTIEE